MKPFIIDGYCNIDDERTCPHCGGFKDGDQDICEECERDFIEPEGDDDGPFEAPDEELDEVCEECGAQTDLGRCHGRWLCDDCDDLT